MLRHGAKAHGFFRVIREEQQRLGAGDGRRDGLVIVDKEEKNAPHQPVKGDIPVRGGASRQREAKKQPAEEKDEEKNERSYMVRRNKIPGSAFRIPASFDVRLFARFAPTFWNRRKRPRPSG